MTMSETCKKSSTPLVMHAGFSALMYKDRMMYFSVYTQSKDYFSKFGRVRVTLDSETGVWTCKCPVSSERCVCEHEVLSKWYVAQTQPSKMLLNWKRYASFVSACAMFILCFSVLFVADGAVH